MQALCAALDAGYHDPGKLSIIEQLSFDGVQNYIVDIAGRRVGLVLGVQEETDWLDFCARVNWRTDRGDTTQWAAGPLAYAAVTYAFFKNKRLDEIAGHSLGSSAGIVGVSLKIPTTCFAPMPILHGTCALDTSWVRNIALSDEPLLAIAKLGPWLSFLVPPRIVRVPEMWSLRRPSSWGRLAAAHSVVRYQSWVGAVSAFA